MAAALPNIVERTSRGEYAIDPYSKLLSERVVFLGTAVDDTAANDILAQLLYLDYDKPERDISLYVNSPGGSLTAMMTIYDTMRVLRCDVRTVCLGQAASAAALLLAAGTPGKRMMLPNARVVLHQPRMEVSQGSTSDLAIQARELLRMRTAMEEILAEHTGRDLDQIRRDLDRETILDGSQAVAYGLVDLLLPVRELRRAA
ncbi:MAG: ATP-dependent Clp protease proteolytic subunit [Actinobacteria bacterium]|nr:MAG: ATP-dependent Clp protease proteolytic subunit [Actinomycetota bacterium]